MENLMYLGTMQHEIWPKKRHIVGQKKLSYIFYYKEFSLQETKHKRGRLTPYVANIATYFFSGLVTSCHIYLNVRWSLSPHSCTGKYTHTHTQFNRVCDYKYTSILNIMKWKKWTYIWVNTVIPHNACWIVV